MSADLERQLVDWLVSAGLDGADEQMLLDGYCDRLNAAGFCLTRAFMASEVLHPLHEASGFVWRESGIAREDYRFKTAPHEEGWQQSTFFYILENDLPRLRILLDGSRRSGRFPLLRRLRDEGGTDYLALACSFGDNASLGEFRGVVSSWTTGRPEGFTDPQLDLLERCKRPLALAYKAIATVDTGRTLMRTYLGHDAGARVTAGEIRRGEAAAIDAVLWYSDLRGFTRLADTTEPTVLMGLLNAYAEGLAHAVETQGGDILKFVGDGILAIFRDDATGDGCARALRAALAARQAVETLRRERLAEGLPVTDFCLGLHRGTVLFGNIGSPTRLDFTVIGPAVNEVSRIESMCRSLEQPVVVSAAFADACGDERHRLVSLGRYALRGVGRAQELFTIEPQAG